MRLILPALFALSALAACGSGNEAPNTAAAAHEQRADTLREAAEQSTPQAANQLENLAAQHEQKADMVPEGAPAPGNIVGAPMPDNMAQPAPAPAIPPQR